MSTITKYRRVLPAARRIHMKLIWNGHACFTAETAQGTLVLDPYADRYVPGLSPLDLTADRVLCSHGHKDHCAAEIVKLTGNTPTFTVESFSTYHDPEQGALRGENTVYILHAEGMRVAHLGDLGCDLTEAQLSQLKGVDAVMIPVGGFYTIDARQAKALVDKIAPKVVIPMHYRSDSFGYDVLGTVEDYTALCDNTVRYPGNTLELNADTPAQTAILTYCG